MKTFYLLLWIIIAVFLSVEGVSAQNRTKKEWTPHYQAPGRIALGLQWFVLEDAGALSPPAAVIAEITVLKNFSSGVYFGYYYSRIRQDNDYYSTWLYEIRVNHLSAGVQVKFHFSPWLKSAGMKLKPWKTDCYLATAAGLRMQTYLDDETTSDEPAEFSAMLGVRYFHSKRLGFLAEAGWSQNGILDVGITYVLGKVR